MLYDMVYCVIRIYDMVMYFDIIIVLHLITIKYM